MSNQDTHNTQQSFEVMAANVKAYIDERTQGGVDDINLESKIDALLKSKLGAALLAAPNPVEAIAASPVITAAVNTAETTVTDYRQLQGMCPKTGKRISGIEYLKSRLSDAIHTPKHSQVLLRERGSNVPDLIDSPQNQKGTLSLMAAIAQAISDPLSGVPDFILTRIKILSAEINGKLVTELTGKWLGSDIEVTI